MSLVTWLLSNFRPQVGTENSSLNKLFLKTLISPNHLNHVEVERIRFNVSKQISQSEKTKFHHWRPIRSVLHNFLSFEVTVHQIFHWKSNGVFCFCFSYINYSNIAARVLRGALKQDLKADALKRSTSNIKFTKWTDGKPASK